MKILGFNFTKFNAEKLSGKLEGVKLKTNIDITSISEVKSDIFGEKEKILGIGFTNTISYDPDFAKIEIGGNLIVTVDEEVYDKVLEDWKKKEMPEDFRLTVF